MAPSTQHKNRRGQKGTTIVNNKENLELYPLLWKQVVQSRGIRHPPLESITTGVRIALQYIFPADVIFSKSKKGITLKN